MGVSAGAVRREAGSEGVKWSARAQPGLAPSGAAAPRARAVPQFPSGQIPRFARDDNTRSGVPRPLSRAHFALRSASDRNRLQPGVASTSVLNNGRSVVRNSLEDDRFRL